MIREQIVRYAVIRLLLNAALYTYSYRGIILPVSSIP